MDDTLGPHALHPRMVSWWTDDPADPARLPPDNSEVQQLCAAIAPGARLTDLGGVMNLNVRIDRRDSGSLVLRVHQPDECVSRPRLLALQVVRSRLAARGLRVPVALPLGGSTVFRCGKRWAELEEFIPNERPAPTIESYLWLYGAMGTVHRELVALPFHHMAVPRPVAATYAPPGSLRRWLPVTAAAVEDDPEATEIVRLLRDLVRRLRRQWAPAAQLPLQLVHGDVRLGNICRTAAGTPVSAAGETVYFDFGFLARRPRIHDLAYSLAFMVWALGYLPVPQRFPWESVRRLIEAYEAAAGWCLTPVERRALAPYTAAVPLCHAALDGFTADPAGKLRTRLPFLRLSEWLLNHPEVGGS